MKRMMGSGYREAIRAALDVIPEPLHRLLECDFLCGVDPILAGLHEFEETFYGSDYRDTPHCAYPFHQEKLLRPDRVTTVVLPTAWTANVATVVHELGHVLDYSTGFRWEPGKPATQYALSNKFECFAEAFTSFVVPGYGDLSVAEGRRFVALVEQVRNS